MASLPPGVRVVRTESDDVGLSVTLEIHDRPLYEKHLYGNIPAACAQCGAEVLQVNSFSNNAYRWTEVIYSCGHVAEADRRRLPGPSYVQTDPRETTDVNSAGLRTRTARRPGAACCHS